MSAACHLGYKRDDAQGLARLAEIAEELGEALIAEDIRQLLGRVSEGRFFVACVGQFKRGKSTLLNALVGESILPTGVVPVTSVPTILRHADQRTARVLIDHKWHSIRPGELSQYVSEELNPQNIRQVEGVEVCLPCLLLASGMCLVDTPGIGSVFAGNTETTKDFIPQIDAAILVVGADPPISGEELALIEAVAANVDEILVVLNKIDRVSATEREQASVFAAKVLAARIKKPVERIYQVSAINRLTGTSEPDDWELLVGNLGALATKCGKDMTRSAAERGLLRFSASLKRSVEERKRALNEPIEDSEQRIAGLRRTVSHAEQSLRDLGALFSAEQMRLSSMLLARRKEFFSQALPTATAQFQQESRMVHASFGPERRRALMTLAQTIARGYVMPWLDAEEAHAEKLYRSAMKRFVSLINELLQRISDEQSADFSHLPTILDAEQGFRTRSRFYFHDMITIAEPASPLLYSLDVLMGACRMRRWFQRDAEHFLEQLLDTNAARVQGDVEQRVVESRLRLESEVRKLLREVSTSAEQALLNAREVIATGTSAVANEMNRLETLRIELAALAVGQR
jgi:GTPase SAR1 family protein